ncbi:MAG TPA: ankyrin repeat domain-containing protein [Chthonomonadaceae bacterium]|nr:ankyrin repeat domain-containing protein [Chthonomonadaceae bacterium]
MAKMGRANILLYVLIGIILSAIGFTRYRVLLNDRLLAAVHKNREAEAWTLLRRGADPNYSCPLPEDNNQRDYVLVAAIQEHTSLGMVQALLEHGANPNPRTAPGESPIDQAIGVNRPDILRLLLERGGRATEADSGLATHRAAMQPSLESYRLLRSYGFPSTVEDAVRVGDVADVARCLDQGEDINRQNTYGATLLMQALTYRQLEVAKMLVTRGADVNRASRFSTILRLAQQVRNPEIIARLQSKGARISLTEAIQIRDIRTVRERIREGADVNLQEPDYEKRTPAPDNALLFQAVVLQDREIVRTLLKAGANVQIRSMNGQTPLMWAAQRGDPDIVRALLAAGADPNATDHFTHTALKAAIQFGHPDLYPLLQEYGAKLDLCDAASIGDVAAIRRLVQQGADVNRADREGNTPLMLAAERGRIPALQTLLGLGAKLESVTPYGETALMKVVWSDQTDSVRILLDYGANPNVASAGGRTAVMRAAESGRLENLRELLAKGGNPQAVTLRGDTALKMAIRRGHAEVVALLHQSGAEE